MIDAFRRFSLPLQAETHGDVDFCLSIEHEAEGDQDDAWARGVYVTDQSGLVVTDVPFRNPNGLGFGLLEKDEAIAVATLIATLLTAELTRIAKQ